MTGATVRELTGTTRNHRDQVVARNFTEDETMVRLYGHIVWCTSHEHPST